MFVSPDSVSDYGYDDNCKNNSEYWPDLQNPLYGRVDKESAEH